MSMSKFNNGRAVTVDITTTNCLSQSALARPSAEHHLAALEGVKRGRYTGYYSTFRPLAISLTGAVSEDSFSTVKAITVAAARADGAWLDWEPYRWAVNVLRRLQIAVLRAVASDLTRAPSGVRGADRAAPTRTGVGA